MLTWPALEEFRELFLRGLRRFCRGHFVRFTETLAHAKLNKMPGKKTGDPKLAWVEGGWYNWGYVGQRVLLPLDEWRVWQIIHLQAFFVAIPPAIVRPKEILGLCAWADCSAGATLLSLRIFLCFNSVGEGRLSKNFSNFSWGDRGAIYVSLRGAEKTGGNRTLDTGVWRGDCSYGKRCIHLRQPVLGLGKRIPVSTERGLPVPAIVVSSLSVYCCLSWYACSRAMGWW